VKFLREHAVEPNTKMTYAQLLNSHIYPFIGKRRVAEIGRETIHRLLTVVLPEEGASQNTVVNVRTCLSAMLQMAWDHGYRSDNPVKGIRLKHPPSGPIIVATVSQFQRVYAALPHQPAKVFARLGVSTGARHCELISFIPEDFDFAGCMLTVSKSTVEVTADFHPEGHRFLTRQYTKNGEHRRMKIDAEVAEMVREHIVVNSIGLGQLIFPVRLFAARTVATRRERMSEDEMEALGYTDPLPTGKQYKHGTLGAYVTAKCRCPGCMQWNADYGRSRKCRKTGHVERQWSAGLRRDPTEYVGKHTWYRIWNSAVQEANRPGPRLPGQVSAPPKKPGGDAGPGERNAYHHARRRQSQRRIMVEHAIAEPKQWRPLQRWTGHRDDLPEVIAAIGALVSDRAARRPTRRKPSAELVLADPTAC